MVPLQSVFCASKTLPNVTRINQHLLINIHHLMFSLGHQGLPRLHQSLEKPPVSTKQEGVWGLGWLLEKIVQCLLGTWVTSLVFKKLINIWFCKVCTFKKLFSYQSLTFLKVYTQFIYKSLFFIFTRQMRDWQRFN